jgi:hypothetical protein
MCFATFTGDGCHNDWHASTMSEIQFPTLQKYFPLLQRPDKLKTHPAFCLFVAG